MVEILSLCTVVAHIPRGLLAFGLSTTLLYSADRCTSRAREAPRADDWCLRWQCAAGDAVHSSPVCLSFFSLASLCPLTRFRSDLGPVPVLLEYALNIILVTEFGNQGFRRLELFLARQVYHDSIFGCNGDDLRSDGSCVRGPSDAALLPSMEVRPSNFWFYMAVMLSVFVVFRTAALGALVSKAKSI